MELKRMSAAQLQEIRGGVAVATSGQETKAQQNMESSIRYWNRSRGNVAFSRNNETEADKMVLL
jgi:predicted Zn-dependent protease